MCYLSPEIFPQYQQPLLVVCLLRLYCLSKVYCIVLGSNTFRGTATSFGRFSFSSFVSRKYCLSGHKIMLFYQIFVHLIGWIDERWHFSISYIYSSNSSAFSFLILTASRRWMTSCQTEINMPTTMKSTFVGVTLLASSSVTSYLTCNAAYISSLPKAVSLLDLLCIVEATFVAATPSVPSVRATATIGPPQRYIESL
jgi:hypothetical protein